MFVIESAISKAAEELGITASEIQQKNLLKNGDQFPYGQLAQSEANECWEKAVDLFEIDKLKNEIEEFNNANKLFKKGISFMPICFGISFTKTLMNQGMALVHIYTDGSVSISTGAVEMGQGVNTKMLQVAAAIFSLGTNKIKVHSTNTFRIANTSPSAASTTADLNGRAVEIACNVIADRLKKVAAEMLNTDLSSITLRDELVYANDKQTELSWKTLILTAYSKRINLSEHSHYTPTDHPL